MPDASTPNPIQSPRRDDLVTSVFAAVAIVGLYLDGWAHLNLYGDRLGTFLTPWHGVLYVGFGLTAGWTLTRAKPWVRSAHGRRAGRDVLLGVGLAEAAIVGDATWHTLFGEEQGIVRLLAPFHLVLFAALAVLITVPLRSAWRDVAAPDATRTERKREPLVPALISLTLLVALAEFVLQFVSPFVPWIGVASSHDPALAEPRQVLAVAQVLVTTVVVLGPLLVAATRWRLPVGSATAVLTTVPMLLALLGNGDRLVLVVGGVVAGTVGDGLLLVQRRRWTNAVGVRAVGVVVPAVWWGVTLPIGVQIGAMPLTPEAALGSVVLAAGAGYLIAMVASGRRRDLLHAPASEVASQEHVAFAVGGLAGALTRPAPAPWPR